MIEAQLGGDASQEFVAGAALGRLHRGAVDEWLGSQPPDEPCLVLLDFGRISSATASYLKATWLELHVTGQRALRNEPTAPPGSPPVRDVYPVVARINEELRHELSLLATVEGVVALEATQLAQAPPRAGRVLGRLERSARETLAALVTRSPASGAQLHAARPEAGVAATAWNNRLVELCRLRLAWRSRAGRQVLYQPIIEEFEYG